MIGFSILQSLVITPFICYSLVRQRKASLPEMLSQEIKSYFENLILTLPIKKDLANVKDEVIGKVEELAMKINIMENRIVELENKFHKADKKN